MGISRQALAYRYKHAKGRILRSRSQSPRQIREVLQSHQRSADVAVVLHVFYPEQWELYSAQLEHITSPYHLFVTTTREKLPEVRSAVGERPECTIIMFPNRGRDVLPFLHTMRLVDTLGYTSILKLHTKKSTHRLDGVSWAAGMLGSLLPSKAAVAKLLKTLENPDTGIIGPAGEYLQLSVNFEANGMHMTHILNKLYGKTISHRVLQTERMVYGFFAGSMFWAPVAVMRPLVRSKFIDEAYFEKEAGQVDATFAHALERVFSLIAEIEHKTMYEISAKGLKRIDYRTDNVPDWSGVYIGPKV